MDTLAAVEIRQNLVRPRSVTVAGVLQVLFALAYLIAPVSGMIFGTDVQAAAEAELARQGFSPNLLSEKGIRFDESGVAMVVPIATAVIAAILAWLNLAGKRAGRILTLIVQPIFLALDVFIALNQASQVRILESILGNGVDAHALINVTERAYPTWLFTVTDARLILTPVASVAVIVALLLPSARAYMRK